MQNQNIHQTCQIVNWNNPTSNSKIKRIKLITQMKNNFNKM
jgi:hypothetical protein